jgi:gamma-glutamyltranspeptidase / glutathione hydrolase
MMRRVGVNILEKGGTAADAAVAIAAALNVTEPCSTGIGGDAFALYYEASTRKVSCLMGNGAAPAAISLEYLNSKGIGAPSLGFTPLDCRSGLTVTVPGAAALWEDLLRGKGKMTMTEVLKPAISLAEDGFSLGPITSGQWSRSFLQGEEAQRVFRPGGAAPLPGELFTNPDLGQTFRELAAKGAAEGFYRGNATQPPSPHLVSLGRIGNAIVEACRAFDGVLSAEDLQVPPPPPLPRRDMTSPGSPNRRGHSMQRSVQRLSSV